MLKPLLNDQQTFWYFCHLGKRPNRGGEEGFPVLHSFPNKQIFSGLSKLQMGKRSDMSTGASIGWWMVHGCHSRRKKAIYELTGKENSGKVGKN